jgi:2-dehydropantoate 2-reductase
LESGTISAKEKIGGCLPTDRLLSDPGWEELVRELMLEVIAAANAQGHKLSTELAEKQIERTRKMGAYKASTLLDFENGKALEMESLFLGPLQQARQAGVDTPRLEALCAVLKALDPGNRPN